MLSQAGSVNLALGATCWTAAAILARGPSGCGMKSSGISSTLRMSRGRSCTKTS
jgi:hypothetical protein